MSEQFNQFENPEDFEELGKVTAEPEVKAPSIFDTLAGREIPKQPDAEESNYFEPVEAKEDSEEKDKKSRNPKDYLNSARLGIDMLDIAARTTAGYLKGEKLANHYKMAEDEKEEFTERLSEALAYMDAFAKVNPVATFVIALIFVYGSKTAIYLAHKEQFEDDKNVEPEPEPEKQPYNRENYAPKRKYKPREKKVVQETAPVAEASQNGRDRPLVETIQFEEVKN
jgi:hypothetical protein